MYERGELIMDMTSLIDEGFSPQRAKEILQKYSDLKNERQKKLLEAQSKKQDRHLEYDYVNNPYADYEEDMGAPNGYLSDFSY